MAISEGGSFSNTGFTSSMVPGKGEKEPVLTAGEKDDLLGFSSRVLDLPAAQIRRYKLLQPLRESGASDSEVFENQ